MQGCLGLWSLHCQLHDANQFCRVPLLELRGHSNHLELVNLQVVKQSFLLQQRLVRIKILGAVNLRTALKASTYAVLAGSLIVTLVFCAPMVCLKFEHTRSFRIIFRTDVPALRTCFPDSATWTSLSRNLNAFYAILGTPPARSFIFALLMGLLVDILGINSMVCILVRFKESVLTLLLFNRQAWHRIFEDLGSFSRLMHSSVLDRHLAQGRANSHFLLSLYHM